MWSEEEREERRENSDGRELVSPEWCLKGEHLHGGTRATLAHTRTRTTRGTGTEERDGRDNLCERSATPASRRKIPQKSPKNNLSQEAAGGASASLAQTILTFRRDPILENKLSFFD